MEVCAADKIQETDINGLDVCPSLTTAFDYHQIDSATGDSRKSSPSLFLLEKTNMSSEVRITPMSLADAGELVQMFDMDTNQQTASADTLLASADTLLDGVANSSLEATPKETFTIETGSSTTLTSTSHVTVMQNCSPTLSSHGFLLSADDNNISKIPDSSSQQINFQTSSETNESYECKWIGCKELLNGLDEFVNHVNDVHIRIYGRDTDYKCHWEGCPRKGKGFNARYKMLIHVRTHTNEKPHKCTKCGKSFSRLENLKIHTRSHTGEKPYLCPVEGCNKAYSNSSDRFKHVRTHQEEKPYPCRYPNCPKRYTDPSSLRKHIKTNGHSFRGSIMIDHSTSSSTDTIIKTVRTMPKPIPLVPVPIIGGNPEFLSQLSVGSNVPTHIISLPSGVVQSGNMLYMSSLNSNPLLSAAMIGINHTMQSTSTQTDNDSDMTPVTPTNDLPAITPTNDLPADSIMVDAKNQDGPLDLSTSPILTHP